MHPRINKYPGLSRGWVTQPGLSSAKYNSAWAQPKLRLIRPDSAMHSMFYDALHAKEKKNHFT